MSRNVVKDALTSCLPIAMGFILGALICLLITLCGCSTTKYVEVEVPKVVTQTNIERRTDIVRDTIIQRDSVIIVQRGDTIYHETWHHIRDVSRHHVADTIRDTIPQVATITQKIPVYVEKKLTKWQQFKLDAGGVVLTITGAALLALIAWLIWRARKLRRV